MAAAIDTADVLTQLGDVLWILAGAGLVLFWVFVQLDKKLPPVIIPGWAAAAPFVLWMPTWLGALALGLPVGGNLGAWVWIVFLAPLCWCAAQVGQRILEARDPGRTEALTIAEMYETRRIFRPHDAEKLAEQSRDAQAAVREYHRAEKRKRARPKWVRRS